MQLLVADFETFFSDEYTLKKLSTEAYIRDKRFEAHGCAIYIPSHPGPPLWIDGPDLPWFFSKIDWSRTLLLNHHAHFDGLILSHHYGIVPRMYGCTLSMARMLLGNHISVSLDSVRQQFGLQPKRTPYHLFKGKHWSKLSPAVRREVAEGAKDEVVSIYTIFQKMMREFPREELEVIDIAVRMFTQPILRADVDLLADVWESERKKKIAATAALGVSEADLQSADRFTALLEAEGVEVEYKEGKNGLIPAFAKSDEFMERLLDDEDDRVRALAEGRLGIKSSIVQTRAQTLAEAAQRGPLPVYLRPYGAGTLRFSGGDATNFQNFNRKDPDSTKQASPLRRAILSPEGHLLAPIDLAQIECRVLAYLAGQTDLLEKFRRKEDPYIGIASVAYGYPVLKEMKAQRGVGKQLELSCGYGAAETTIQRTARLGTYGPPVHIDLATALRWKEAYREHRQAIVDYWRTAGRMIARLAGGSPLQWGPLRIEDRKIYLPNGARMNYDTINYHVPTEEEKKKLKPFEWGGYWRVKTRQGWKTLYGAKIVQNVCEAVSRNIVTQAAIRITRAGYRVLNVPHDELLCLVPNDGKAEGHAEWCRQEMMRTPDWLPDLPLDAELPSHGIGVRYAE